MNSFDIASGRTSTMVHAAPGGKSTFSLAHSEHEGMTPREQAAVRKLERQAEADRQYRAMSQMLDNDGTRKVFEDSSAKLFGVVAPAEAAKPDLFKLSAPFAEHTEQSVTRPSTRVNAAPGGRQTLILGSDSPTWGKEDDFNKVKPLFQGRSNRTAHPEMTAGGNMASLLGNSSAANVTANRPPPREISSVFPSKVEIQSASAGPPDTSAMTHKERVAAMKAFRNSQENFGGASVGVPSLQKQLTAGKNDDASHTTECSIGDRPSSRVLAPPGGKSNFTFG